MAKLKLTRPELKRHRDALARFERYLPMLKLKQQQLQLTLREIEGGRRKAQSDLQAAEEQIRSYQAVLSDRAGLDVRGLSRPEQIKTTTRNIAGVEIPVFQDAVFTAAIYTLFATPAWVDRALVDMRQRNRCQAQTDVFDRQYDLINGELTKIIQRVNLFEKIKIPEAREAIRIIRIHLGDEMTAAVGRAKIAKAKILESETDVYGDVSSASDKATESQEP